MINPDKNDKEDFFDGPDIPEQAPEPKKPAYKPEDPDYWEEDESEWDHLRPQPGAKPWLWLLLSVLIVGVGAAAWLRWFSPHVSEAVQYGYVEHLERRGDIFKTYEGILLPYKELHDTARVYREDFVFSVAGKEAYRELRKAQRECRPVAVEYKVYHGALPWRGASTKVITAVDTVSPSRILPPL